MHDVLIAVAIAIVSAVAGGIGTGILAKLNRWWDDKTTLPQTSLDRIKALELSVDKLWINDIALRESIESGSQIVKDRQWVAPKARRSSDETE